jgi:8-oxo-dGTP pyrophosphatase MutT (NUDIX family)
MPLARFIALHASTEEHAQRPGCAKFAIVLARAPSGVVLVFNRYRKVWELPGGLVDPGENLRTCAAHEFREEAGSEAGTLRWLGLLEVEDGQRHFGGVFGCTLAVDPPPFESDETGGISFWRERSSSPEPLFPPAPLGDSDDALLHRFAAALAESPT